MSDLKKLLRRKARRPLLLAAASAAVLVVLIGSCKTAPGIVSAQRAIHFLPDGAAVYGKLNGAQNPALTMALAALFMPVEGDMTEILERTETILFSVGGGEPNAAPVPQVFSLAVQGKFPKGLTKTVIQADKNWGKQKAEIPWWEHGDSGLQLAVPEAGLILISSGDIAAMLENYRSPKPKKIVYEAQKEFDVSDLVIYIADPGSSLLQGLPVDPEKFPLQALWFTLFKEGDVYRMGGVFALKDASKAKIMATLSRILIIGWVRTNELSTLEKMKEGLVIEPAGASIRMDGLTVNNDGIIRLMTSFLPDRGLLQ